MNTNLLDSDKGNNFLPPPAIFLSEATSDGEDTPEDNQPSTNQGPRLVKCEAVLTDVEYSSDEEVVERKCVSPMALNCSSESQVVERIYNPDLHKLTDELTDTENVNLSDDDLTTNSNEDKENDVILFEDGHTTISDQIKTNSKVRNRFGNNINKNDELKKLRNDYCISGRDNYAEYSSNKDYLAPVNKLGKKKKRKGKLLLESCLTDTEDVDVPSDVDDSNRVMKKDVSYQLFPSEKEEQEYTNRIKHTSGLRGTEKFTLMEFLTDKLDEGGITDTDDILYSDCEDLLDGIKETEYEMDFSHEVSNKETVVNSSDRKTKKKRSTRHCQGSADSDDDEPAENLVKNTRTHMSGSVSESNNCHSTGNSYINNKDDVSATLTDTEDFNYSDGESGSSSRPKCPTPEVAFFESSTIFQNESLKLEQALEVISDADPLTDCEELFISPSPRKHRPKGTSGRKMGPLPSVRIVGEGHTDTEELFLSDADKNARHSEVSDDGVDSCSETDVEVQSNIGDPEEYRRRAPSVTPECLRNMDNTYIANIEGSEAYLKQIKGNKSRSLSGPPVICSVSYSPAQETDSEDIQTSGDETAEEFSYNRACTPSNFFEKFNLENQSCVIHEKNTRSFETDGAESIHIKDPSYQNEPVTDCEDIPLLD